MEKLPLISFKEVIKTYPGGIAALQRVSFDIEPGEFTFIVGPSGAGKSTVVRLLIRQEFPTNGTIQFDNINVVDLPRNLLSTYRQQLGIVFQDLKLIDSKTVRENIQFALEVSKRTPKEVNETTDYLLDIVSLKGRSHLFPQELSGGERQRVAIARGLANDPKLLIADEPTGNLDPATAMEILNILRAVNELGTTVLVITHDKNIVDMMQKRVLHMEEGKIVADEQGGYFKKKHGKKSEKVKVESKSKKEGKEEKDAENKSTSKLEDLGMSKEVAQKLAAAKIDDIELLINCTEEDLEKIGITGKMLDEVGSVVENYLKSK